jgi:hypothetical protein
MPTSQTTLTDTDDTATNDATTRTATTPDESVRYTTLAPPEQRGGERCCPWCLAAPETFEHREEGHVRCGYCDAVIPIGTDWFERGEKIVA